jgi:Fe-S cluster assembly iron-binding protein IscA
MTLQVTDQATQQLKTLLESTDHEPEQVIRLGADELGNAGFSLDVPREGDQVIEHEGEQVMVVEPTVSESLEGITLDVNETPQGVAFTLRK